MGLFYLGVHEYGTAGSKVDGVLGKESGLREILDAVVQGVGEVLDEGTAAGRTGLVELYAVHGVIFDLDAFHVLAADVKDAVYVWIKEGSSVVMGDGLHLALVQHQAGFDQGLAVTGGAGVDDSCGIRHQGVDLLDGADGGF